MIGSGIALSDTLCGHDSIRSALYSPDCPKMFPNRWITPLGAAPAKHMS